MLMWQKRNEAVKGATRTVYLLGSNFKRQQGAISLEQMRSLADAFTRWWVWVTQLLNSAVRSSVKRLNSVMNTNDSVM